MEARHEGQALTPPPLGVTVHDDGAFVAVYSQVATAVDVSVFDEAGREQRHRLDDRSGDIHHGFVEGLGFGERYGLRVDGPWNPSDGLRCNPAKLLIDPYAQALVGTVDWSGPVHGTLPDGHTRDERDSAGAVPKCLVVDHTFDWGGDAPLRRPAHETIIYETHIRSLTMLHPGVPAELRGTYAGMACAPIVEHLTELGVTAVELLPLQQFVDDERLWKQGLRNLWGYQPVAWCAPHNGYAANPAPGAAVTELKNLVKTLHAAGIEVILDVVYNHTAESEHIGPTLSFRGIDNHAYYRLDPDDPYRYLNYSGTGNTINADSPAVIDLVVDSLRGWVTNYHIDGFRFDLASTLGRRGLDVRFDPAAPLLAAISNDPVIAGAKLIAEPWDVGFDGYQLGSFPSGWLEWNDQYRQTVRDFWRGTPGLHDSVATRMMGSRDIFDVRGPSAGVNYVTSHDGYTLNDVVSYELRHNHANGEGNRDGSPDNRSWNGGAEGPSDDPAITENRLRRRRSMLATLLLSRGVPMLLGGDELGRTQRGNNNAYPQDNDTSWYHWEAGDESFLAFVKRAIRLRKATHAFGGSGWLAGDRPAQGRAEAVWFDTDGEIMSREQWEADEARPLAVAIHPIDGWRRLGEAHLVFLNGMRTDVTQEVPAIPHAPRPQIWVCELDTSSSDPEEKRTVKSGDAVTVPAHSVIVLRHIGDTP